ncbi:hypothetical protein [Pyxidicoccus xibeiensis]|uniref:hypothetical protein n=1 Tax=Pyxidicoccus xibeiensis TaxID=2906759 RepID=UPI0020A81ECB|nr:hypothetical protein [Pyxidicoccus xibeiensis]MCP3136929.1 hypothetical protein [Pyxidicoccus xibeiensis]
MLRAPHHLLRGLRLLMACLALALGGTPAHAVPRPDAPVAVLLAGRLSAPLREQRVQVAPVRVEPLRLVVSVSSTVPAPATDARSASRRLFLLHRALLR